MATEVAAVVEFTGFILVPDGGRRGRIEPAVEPGIAPGGYLDITLLGSCPLRSRTRRAHGRRPH